MLLAQDTVAVELYRRDGDGWSCTTLGPDDTLALELAGGVTIPLRALYDGVPIDGAS